MTDPMPSEAQDIFERYHGPRPVEPYCSNEDPESWAEIAEWEWKRAEFFTWLFVFRDIEEAIRRVP